MAAQRVRLTLAGGPLDGMDVRRVSGDWAWIDRRGRVSPKPVDLRALYRLERRGDGHVYAYAGHRWSYCNGCGSYHGKAEGGREKAPCPLAPAPAPEEVPHG